MLSSKLVFSLISIIVSVYIGYRFLGSKLMQNSLYHSEDKGHESVILQPMSKSSSALNLCDKMNDSSRTSGRPVVLGIAGGSGSGKTTLASAIYETIGTHDITYLTHDNYYKDLSHLSVEERATNNFDHPDSLDTALLIDHVTRLRNGENVFMPTYNFRTHSRNPADKSIFLTPRPIILVEGILILSDPALFELFDIRVFVDTDADIRLIRRLRRDTVERGRTVEGVFEQYLNTVRPMHMEFVEPSKRNAHIIVPVGLNPVALDLVVSKLKSVIDGFTIGSDNSSDFDCVDGSREANII